MRAKFVWVAGMPRAGSMWTFNVTRAALRNHGFKVLPEYTPKNDQDMLAVYEQNIADDDPETVFVLKTHSPILQDLSRSLFISNERDLRDAMISMMRFTRCGREGGLQRTLGMAAVVDYFHTFDPDKIIHLRYDDVIARPDQALASIITFLGLEPDPSLHDVIAEFSKERVQKLIKQQHAKLVETIAVDPEKAQENAVFNNDGSARVYDHVTGFQGGHVSDYKDGSWREILPHDILTWLDNQLGQWFKRHGYPPCFAPSEKAKEPA
jgi:hypothetical protein